MLEEFSDYLVAYPSCSSRNKYYLPLVEVFPKHWCHQKYITVIRFKDIILAAIPVHYDSNSAVKAQFLPNSLLLLASDPLGALQETQLIKAGIGNGLFLDGEKKRVAYEL